FGSGGLVTSQLGIMFNANVLQIATAAAGTNSGVSNGTASNGNTVETINFAPGISDGTTFQLVFANTVANGATHSSLTTPLITYSSTPATLATNIQTALGSLTLIGAANASVTAPDANTAQVTFQGTVGGSTANANAAFGQRLLTQPAGNVNASVSVAYF